MYKLTINTRYCLTEEPSSSTHAPEYKTFLGKSKLRLIVIDFLFLAWFRKSFEAQGITLESEIVPAKLGDIQKAERGKLLAA